MKRTAEQRKQDQDRIVAHVSTAAEEQIAELAESIATLAQAIGSNTVTGPRYAAVRRLADSVDTLSHWVGDDR